MPNIDFRATIKEVRLHGVFRECTPKLLVVTDNLNYDAGDDFGLTQFVGALAASTIHGMTPQVIKAARGAMANADIENFDFTDAAHGLRIGRYDVLFLFGIDRESNRLPAPEVDAIARFMQAGGGVFATGDHEDLGAGFSAELPRVRSMRFWRFSETPNIGNTTRLSTNLPGDDSVYQFTDQSDRHPQRLYLNYRTDAGGIGNPHPLVQGPPSHPAIEIFPDHPHEGECRLPRDLTTRFTLDGIEVDEWPAASGGGGRVAPEGVARTMSHGDAFPGKQALEPRDFLSIAAYDGHRAGVGRVATDATWHHFVNTNLDGTLSPWSGLDAPERELVFQYYRNLATWLMPAKTRRCLRFPWIITHLRRFPLFEELRVEPLAETDGAALHDIGLALTRSVAAREPRWLAEVLVADALADALGAERAQVALGLGAQYGRLSPRELGLAALGGVVVGAVTALDEAKDRREIDPHALFDPLVAKAAAVGIQRYVDAYRRDLRAIDELVADIGC
jgi:hypothetical protein